MNDKLEYFDQIEGYTGEKDSYYERSIVSAIEESTGNKIKCYMYHCTNSQSNEHDESLKVPNGDWLQRTKRN